MVRKKLIWDIIVLLGILPALVSCHKVENGECPTFVEWGFSQTRDGKHINIINGLGEAKESVTVLFDTFDSIFKESVGEEGQAVSHSIILRGQTSEKRAAEKVRQLSEKAFNSLPEGFSCPLGYYFSVRIGYGKSESDRTVWSIRFPY